MKIVFDMDNTLIDELGRNVRPGITGVLKELARRGHSLTLWTNSTRDRAITLLAAHKLRGFFSECIYREDYDREGAGKRKDVRSIGAHALVDDDPVEIAWNRARGVHCVQVEPYRAQSAIAASEARRLLTAILKADSIWRRIRLTLGLL